MRSAEPSVEEVDVDYELEGHGWADCTVRIGDRATKFAASYLRDSLRELTSATAALLESGRGGCFSREGERFEAEFEQEPDVVRLSLQRRDDARAHITVTWLHEMPDRSNPRREVLLEGACSTERWGRAVSRALARILEKHGADGYLEQWVEHPFPSQEHERLKNALRSRAAKSDKS